MKVYQVIKIKDGKKWTSPNLASLSIVDKVAKIFKSDATYVRELNLETTGADATRKYAIKKLFSSEENVLENRRVSMYAYGDEIYLRRKTEIESIRENVEALFDWYEDDKGKKKIYYIGYCNPDNSVTEVFAIAEGYVEARDVAIEFGKIMAPKQMAIMEKDVYFDADKCIEDINKQQLFGKNRDAIWFIGTPEEESYYEIVKEIAALNKKYQTSITNNKKLKKRCKELESNIEEWNIYTDSLTKELIKEKEQKVIAEQKLEVVKNHPFKNLFGGRDRN